MFVDAPLAEVEKRDPKGLYAKARAGVIKGASDSRSFALAEASFPRAVACA